MRIQASSGAPAAARLDPRVARRQSYARLATIDAILALGLVSVVCGIAGIFDDGRDAAFLLLAGTVAGAVGVAGRRSLERRSRPAPARVLSGLVLSWTVLVVLGAGVYLATGTITRVDDALVESAAGFSTTSVTTLDPTALNVPMQLWRASTQWVGGFLGILIAVVAMPLALRGTLLAAGQSQRADERLAPTPVIGRRRVAMTYSGLTVGLGVAYLLVGLGGRDSAVHALTTISTGGFSSQPDSFVGFGSGARVVATIGMAIAGSSYFVVWWVLRGRLGPVWRSTELRLYLGLLAAGSVIVALGAESLGPGEAIFTVVSAVSTTGYAVGDWTQLHSSVLMVLLLLIGTGAMSGSAGGGLRIVRAWTLVRFASRELRRQLDPHAIVVIKQGGHAIDERTVEATTGYQIAHLGLCGLAAFSLGAAGVDVTGAIYSGISALSTFGPGVGTGPFGSLEGFSAAGRLLLVPFMMAGRLTILPLLLAVSLVIRVQKGIERGLRRRLRRGRR